MPRVLVVTHEWLPRFTPAIKRLANLCRYLPASGWSPHVLSLDADVAGADDTRLSEEEIERSPALKAAAALPVARVAQDAAAAGLATLRQFGIGAVLSVCPPAEAHGVGGDIARRAGVPWVAMFDDLDEFYIGPADGRSSLERRRAMGQARARFKDVWRVCAGTPRSLEYLRDSYGVEGDVVLPAFDPEDRRVAPHRDPAAPLRLVHAGPVDRVTQNPVALFDALDAVLDADASAADRLRLTIVGSGIDAFLRERLAARASAPMVDIVERMEPWEVLRLQRESDLLVTLHRDDPRARALGGMTRAPVEVAELFAAARPIVLVGGEVDDLATTALRDTRCGVRADDPLKLARLLRGHLAEVQESGSIPFNGEESAMARYSASEQVKRVAALLDAASAERFGSWQRATR